MINYCLGIPIEMLDEARKNRISANKSELSSTPRIINLEEIGQNLLGRFNVEINEDTFECFLKGSSENSLYVFLSAAGRKDKNLTQFDRVAWHPWFDGFCLNIEDPMYKKHNRVSGGWYFGSEKHSHIEGVVSIVKKIADTNGINYSRIFFIGSSASGYAAIASAAMIPASTAIAYNPQVIISNWISPKSFYDATGYDILSKNFSARNDIRGFIENERSNFCIVYNFKSPIDYNKHAVPLLEAMNCDPKYGVNNYKSSTVIINSTPYRLPHHTFWDQHATHMLISIIEREGCGNISNSDKVGALLESVNLKFDTDQKLFFLRKWAKLLSMPWPDHIEKRSSCELPFCSLKIRGLPHFIHYEMIYDSASGLNSVCLHIEEKDLLSRHNFLETAAETINGNYKISQNFRFEVSRDKVSDSDVFHEMNSLIKSSEKFINSFLTIINDKF